VRSTFSSTERHAIHLVVDRLRLIRESWGPEVSIGDIEHLSGHLRELLPGRGYMRAWNLIAPVQPMRSPTIVAPELEYLAPKKKYDWSRIAFAQTAGLETPSVHWWMPLCLMEGAETCQQPEVKGTQRRELLRAERTEPSQAGEIRKKIASQLEVAPPTAGMSGLIRQENVPVGPRSCYKRYKLSKYLNSTCLIHMGRSFTRAELVKSYANKYGGIHIEWAQSGEEHQAMAEAGAGITISGRNPVLYELLSIGQALTNSADALILRKAADDLGLS
jgi:hypothetical protein